MIRIVRVISRRSRHFDCFWYHFTATASANSHVRRRQAITDKCAVVVRQHDVGGTRRIAFASRFWRHGVQEIPALAMLSSLHKQYFDCAQVVLRGVFYQLPCNYPATQNIRC